MNKQGKLINGKVVGGIEWLKYLLPDGSERQGYTLNPVGGCVHQCEWTMPDGQQAECYAKLVAERFARAGGPYEHGFQHIYVRPAALLAPLRVTEPTAIFIDSMSDLFGLTVDAGYINQVLTMCDKAHWHRFISLTKNAPRLRQFELPRNLWVGVSVPPDRMFGRDLSRQQQAAMLRTSLTVLREIQATVKWMSIEPLSWDVADHFVNCGLDWVVIGAATRGATVYQPDPTHVTRLLTVLDAQRIPVFFKGNLRGNPAASPWREEFPTPKGS